MDLSSDHGTPPPSPLEAVANDAGNATLATEPVRLSALWTELVSGLCKIEQPVFSEQSCGLVVTRGDSLEGRGAAPALPKRQAAVLERSLIEGARKSVASQFGLCPSSVAEILKQSFAFMGLSCWPSRIPLVLVLAAHARRVLEWERPAARLVAENQHFPHQTIAVSRPDNELAGQLSPAELAVTRLLVEGKSYAEIARLRETSARTVANQLASVFHRLDVSGRPELLCWLAARKVAAWRPPTLFGRAAQGAAAPRFLRVASRGEH